MTSDVAVRLMGIVLFLVPGNLRAVESWAVVGRVGEGGRGCAVLAGAWPRGG
jgi:hypothetical protein